MLHIPPYVLRSNGSLRAFRKPSSFSLLVVIFSYEKSRNHFRFSSVSEDGQKAVGIPVFIDTLANLIKLLPNGKKTVEQSLLQRFNSNMSSMIKNVEVLGPALLPADSYLRYLLEARDLFVEGFDYGAVAL